MNAPISPSSAELFWARVDKSGECWLWTGPINPKGYGKTKYNVDGKSKNFRVHRLAYELTRGPIPEGLDIDHLCSVRHCVRPDHLEAVTHRENVLRGSSPTIVAHVSDTCLNGHSLLDAYIEPSTGSRRCRICQRAKQRKRYYRRKNSSGPVMGGPDGPGGVHATAAGSNSDGARIAGRIRCRRLRGFPPALGVHRRPSRLCSGHVPARSARQRHERDRPRMAGPELRHALSVGCHRPGARPGKRVLMDTTVQTTRYGEMLSTLRGMQALADLDARLHLENEIKGDRLMADAFRQAYVDRADRVRIYRADAVRPLGDEILAAVAR